MRVTPKAVRALAANAGMPPEVIERHLDALIGFTFVVARRERKECRKKIQHWIHDGAVVKPPLEDVLKTDVAPELEEVYDLL